MIIYAERLLTPAGWHDRQCVTVENGAIQSVEPGEKGDVACKLLAPGLFDIHCHGGEGFYSLIPDENALRAYLLRQAKSGVTDVLIGLSTAPGAGEYRRCLDFAREAMRRQREGLLSGARIQGVHLEGPFLNPARCGAMNPDSMLAPSPETYDRIFGDYDDMVRLVTLAPELPGARELTAHLLKKGIRVQAGHTDATFEQAEQAFGWGVDSVCHTFNAARSIHHRDPGILTAAFLDDSVYCEAICDFRHLHPGIVRMIYRIKGARRMTAISDSVIVTGLADGEHELNGKKYLIVDGTQRVNGGSTLSGGACYLDGGVRNLAGVGIPAEDALRMASETPAGRLGMAGLGAIRPGAQAHMAAFDESLFPVMSFIDETVYTGK